MLTGIEATDASRQAAFFSRLEECAGMLATYEPDLVVVFAPDHFNGLFYDLMPSFCIGIEAQSTRDWGLPEGILRVPRNIAEQCVQSVRRAGFDAAMSYRLRVDHGTTIPLLKVTGALDRFPVLPIVINCAAHPRPDFRRVRLFGHAVGEYIKSLGMRVAVIGSGGLSHDPPTPRFASAAPEVAQRLIDRHVPSREELDKRERRVLAAARALVRGEGPCLSPNADWDRGVLSTLIGNDLERFDATEDETIDRVAGFGGHEIRCWVAAFAAMQAGGAFEATVRYYDIVPEWITGMGIIAGISSPASLVSSTATGLK